jgi:hypothetical protein
MLEGFAAGKADPGVDALKALTKGHYPDTEYDAELSLLRSLAPPARPLGVTAPPYDPARGHRIIGGLIQIAKAASRACRHRRSSGLPNRQDGPERPAAESALGHKAEAMCSFSVFNP